MLFNPITQKIEFPAAQVNKFTVITDESNTTAAINCDAGTKYIFTQPLTQLDISSCEVSDSETVIIFTAGENMTFAFNESIEYVGDFSFSDGSKYIISIVDNIMVAGNVRSSAE